MNRFWIWIPVLALVLSAPAGAQQVYQWKDESGRTHFSNVGPTGGEVVTESGSPRETAEPAAQAPEAAPRETAREKKSDGPYATLSDDAFSSTVSRRRSELRSRLRSAEREMSRIDSEIASYRRTREAAFEEHGAQLQGMTRPENVPSDEEDKLLERKKDLEAEVAAIRKEYDELREAAVDRHGSTPGWWRPLD